MLSRFVHVREAEVTWHAYALVFAIGAFIALKGWFLAPRFSDGNAYLYMAKLVTDGFVPYRDFFFASPPLLIYLAAPIGAVFGFEWRVFGMLPPLLSAVDAIILYALGYRCCQSRLAGLVAAVIYLFSFAVLSTTDFYSGVHVSLTLALLGVLFWQRSHPLLGGVLLGLSVLGKLYMAVLFGAAVLAAFITRRWSQAGRLLIGGGMVMASVSILFWLLAGQAFLDNVVLNHLAKMEGIPKSRILFFFVRRDFLLLLGAMAAFSARRRPPVFVTAPIILVALFFLIFRDVYYLHLKMLIPWLALLWGWGIVPLESLLRRGWQSRPWRDLTLTGWRVLGAVGLIIFASVGVLRYMREQGRAAVIEDFDALVAAVAQRVPPHEPLYGDYTVAPLLALAADRPIYNNYADINPMYFLTKVFDYEQRAAQIARARVRAIVTKNVVAPDGRIISGQERVLPATFFNDYCRPASVFPMAQDYESNAVVLWQCAY